MTAPTTAPTHRRSAGIGRRILAGAAGGIAGGAVFGLMMAMMGMLGMIASMVGSESALVGWGIHMLISIVFGMAITVVAGRWLVAWRSTLVTGLISGVVLWVVGPLLAMPMMMGMPVFAVTEASMLSLVGHIVFGLIAATVGMLILRRRA